MWVIDMLGVKMRRVVQKCYWLGSSAEQHYGGILFGNRNAGQRIEPDETIAEAIANCPSFDSNPGGWIPPIAAKVVLRLFGRKHGEFSGFIDVDMRLRGCNGIWDYDGLHYPAGFVCGDAPATPRGTCETAT
jgi:hypothetical protein